MEKTLYSEENVVFCRLLRELRVGAGLTQTQLAEALDEPQSNVSRVEVGQRRLDLLELRQWLRPLGVSAAEFVARLEERLARGGGAD
ncbi:helix-turn-helix domain-containing protein [Alienimonas sp. DA493]|uniref:helix-turn-helix domain-containing protein n=1 Tax=Alienimonas sp. DA493 TaxID=3373605 RepID=UPI003754F302